MATIRAKNIYFPLSSWVHAVILTCDDHLAVWFKHGVEWEKIGPGWHGVREAEHVWRIRAGQTWYGGVPGVCCLYPSVPGPAYYLAMVSSLSKGRFVWYQLPYHQPYTIVAPPSAPFGCGTGCCNEDIPNTLHATITNSGATDGHYTLTFISAFLGWTSNEPLGLCNAIGEQEQVLNCEPPGPQWVYQVAGSGSTYVPSSLTCSPLQIVYTGVDFTNCGGGNSGTVTITG